MVPGRIEKIRPGCVSCPTANRFTDLGAGRRVMRLSTLWSVDREINADGRSHVIDQIAERWPHDAGSARFFRSSANFIATYQRGGERRFLRFADSTERDRDPIQAELDLVLWLASRGLKVSVPEPSLNGSFLETVEVDGRTYHAVAFIGLSGAQFDSDDLDETGFRRWGDALGSLHGALTSYSSITSTARRSWRDDLTFIERHIPPDAVEIRFEFLDLKAILLSLPAGQDHVGLIHFDFELDNLVWGDNAIAMLDFDDCAHHWYAADIAFALRDLFDAGRAMDDPSVRAFLHGYCARTAITATMVDAIPAFSRLSRLFGYARIARSLDLDPSPEYPDWLNGLIARFQDRNRAYIESLKTWA